MSEARRLDDSWRARRIPSSEKCCMLPMFCCNSRICSSADFSYDDKSHPTQLHKAVIRNLFRGKALAECFLPSLPFPSFLPLPSLFLSLPTRREVTPQIQPRNLRSAVISPSGEKRHLQPPDTFPWLQIQYRVTRSFVNDFDFKFKPVINSNQQ